MQKKDDSERIAGKFIFTTEHHPNRQETRKKILQAIFTPAVNKNSF